MIVQVVMKLPAEHFYVQFILNDKVIIIHSPEWYMFTVTAYIIAPTIYAPTFIMLTKYVFCDITPIILDFNLQVCCVTCRIPCGSCGVVPSGKHFVYTLCNTVKLCAAMVLGFT